MATIYTANSSSQLTAASTTDKVRIATTTSAIAISVGDANVVANLTSSTIIPANTVERSFIVGQNNYIAFINVAGSAGAFSVTPLGMNHANVVNGYMT
jgi:hypothetical protein